MTADNRQYAAALVQTLLGRKLGMTRVQNADGRLVSLTVVQVGTNVVTQVHTEEVDEYSAVQLGFDEIPTHKVVKPMVGHFAKAGVEPRRHLTEIRTSVTDDYELNQELQATVFETGQAIDVSGGAKGKGPAGVMKRHGFTGVSASHGAHHNHRKPGSIGACATPGRVFRGLCVADRTGSVRRAVQNLKIQAVDAERSLLLINGVISGPKNGVVLVRSSVRGA